MEYKILNVAKNDGIGIVTINRPEALNALNSLFFDELNDLLDNGLSGMNVMIITGVEKAFVAGADIAEMERSTPEQAETFARRGQATFRRLEKLDIPVIAAVNGFALGGGCELAMACDFRIASQKAKFGQPEVNLGIIPGFAGTQRLPRLTGLGDAIFLTLTAETIPAEEALRIGLVQKVTEPEKLMEETLAIANKILLKGPRAVKIAKKVIRQGYAMDFDEACDMEASEFAKLYVMEGKEGMKAFLEKRKPNW